MTKNLWAITNVYCGNHEQPVKMNLKVGPQSVFYCCPEYEKRYHGGIGCPNRLSTAHLEELLLIIDSKINAEEKQGNDINLTNYSFIHKGIECKIIEHIPGCLSLQILNRRAVSQQSKKKKRS